MFLKNSKGVPSATFTVFYVGSFVCLIKLMFAGLVIGSYKLGEFTGSDFGIALAALGGVYVLDKKKKNDAV